MNSNVATWVQLLTYSGCGRVHLVSARGGWVMLLSAIAAGWIILLGSTIHLVVVVRLRITLTLVYLTLTLVARSAGDVSESIVEGVSVVVMVEPTYIITTPVAEVALLVIAPELVGVCESLLSPNISRIT